MIKSKNTIDEKEACVNEYLSGADKYYLSGKYSISIRTINRWVANTDIDEVKVRIAKRSKIIPIDIQHELLDILNNNAIFCGYNTSGWNQNRIMTYINNEYGIEINRRIATALMEDAIKINDIGYEDSVYNDIEKLDTLGYSIILLDYIKIGRIKSKEVESLELRKYTEKMLNVNLVIARADERVYLDIIVSELDIVDTRGRNIVTNNSKSKKINKLEAQRKAITCDKYEVLNKIKKAEGNESVVFITPYDRDIYRLQRRKSDIKYFVVHEDIY